MMPSNENFRPSLIIDQSQYQRLVTIANRAAESDPALGEKLLEEVERADVRDPAEMPSGVVRIGSTVTYEDVELNRTRVVQLAFPRDANLSEHRVSILTPVGAALLGLSAGQEIYWEMADGRVKHLRVLSVEQSGA